MTPSRDVVLDDHPRPVFSTHLCPGSPYRRSNRRRRFGGDVWNEWSQFEEREAQL